MGILDTIKASVAQLSAEDEAELLFWLASRNLQPNDDQQLTEQQLSVVRERLSRVRSLADEGDVRAVFNRFGAVR